MRERGTSLLDCLLERCTLLLLRFQGQIQLMTLIRVQIQLSGDFQDLLLLRIRKASVLAVRNSTPAGVGTVITPWAVITTRDVGAADPPRWTSAARSPHSLGYRRCTSQENRTAEEHFSLDHPFSPDTRCSSLKRTWTRVAHRFQRFCFEPDWIGRAWSARAADRSDYAEEPYWGGAGG